LTWVAWIDCTEAEAAAAELPGVTLAAHEKDDGGWRLEAYDLARPEPWVLDALRTFAPSSPHAPQVGKIADRDWVKYSQAALTPVSAGRYVVHTGSYASTVRPGRIGIRIEAGRAFGTGHHATTAGCLEAIDRAAKRGKRVRRAIDLGTGTGVLALATAKRWRRAEVVASDNDAVAVAVARGNVRQNAVRSGRQRGMIELHVADGLRHPRLRGHYDLVVANILARPLRQMAPMIARAVAPSGRLVLAGLLERQQRRVWAAYRNRGLVTARYPRHVAWPILEFTRRA